MILVLTEPMVDGWLYAQKLDYWIMVVQIFIFLRKLHTVFHSGYLNLHFH